MRIALVTAGAGPRCYCENCARDNGLAEALRQRGHEVVAVPLYLPAADGAAARVDGRAAPVFYGAVSLYLGHRAPVLARAAGRAVRVLDSPFLLRMAGAMSGTTGSAGLEDLTISMLRGEDGGQAAELDRLVAWLRGQRPDVVHLSNCLLIGLARRLRRELGTAVVCSLQDEHTWIDAMSAPGRALAWRLIRERAADVSRFLPVSRWYAGFMAERIAVPEDQMVVVPVGIYAAGAPPAPVELHFDPPVVGYLSRISGSMGADILAEAFLILSREGRFPGLRLRLAGGTAASDFPLVRSIHRRLGRAGLGGALDIVRARLPAERARFLSSLTVLSVPVPGGEAFGTFLLEAMAFGVPVVQPRLGGFTEVVTSTGGGMLYEPATAEELASSLATLLADRDRTRALGRRGWEAVRGGYTAAHMAAALEGAIEQSLGRGAQRPMAGRR